MLVCIFGSFLQKAGTYILRKQGLGANLVQIWVRSRSDRGGGQLQSLPSGAVLRWCCVAVGGRDVASRCMTGGSGDVP